MDADVERFADTLDELAAFLASHGESRWSASVAGDARLVRAGGGSGVTRFLLALQGGMGSLNDLVFAPVNGNASTAAEGRELTDRFRRLSHDAWQQATELRRSLE